jgi:hypothetical protein
MKRFTMKRLQTVFLFALFSLIVSFGWANTQDTVDDIQAAGREGIPDTADIKATIDEISSFVNQLNSDPAYMKSFFDAANKADQAGVLNLVRQRVTQSKPSIKQLTAKNSFFLVLSFQTSKGKTFGLCISTDKAQRCPNGKGVDIGPLN